MCDTIGADLAMATLICNEIPTRVDCIVFDKDGTLIDLHALWGAMAERWVAQLLTDAQLSPSVAPKLFDAIGYNRVLQQVVADGPLAVTTLDRLAIVFATALYQQGCDWHRAIASSEAVLGAEDNHVPTAAMLRPLYNEVLFDTLRRAGIKLAVLTSDDRVGTDAALRLLGIDAYFCAVGCADDVGIRPKPAPDGLHRIAKQCGVALEHTIMVGDSNGDMVTGRSAQVAATIGIGHGQRFGDKADLVLASVNDLLHHLKL